MQLHANLVENGLIVPSLDKTNSTARNDSYREMDKTGEGGIDFNEYGGAACALLPQSIAAHARLLLVSGVVRSGLAIEQRSVLRRRGAVQRNFFAVFVFQALSAFPSTPNPREPTLPQQQQHHISVRPAAPRQLPVL